MSLSGSRVEYLGLIISHNWVAMDPAKVAAVTEWPRPRDRKEVQSFLGFINFYQWFIERFSHIAWPMFDLTKKDAPFVWVSGVRCHVCGVEGEGHGGTRAC